MNKALFLDKDGTLIVDVPYNVDPFFIRLEEGVETLKSLQELGYLLVVISNQSGVAHGYFPESALKEVESTLTKLMSEKGLHLDGFYYCPHHPRGRVEGYAIECNCRKPKEGMFLKAAQDLNIDLSQSWMIGDILNDIEAGKKAGCKAILVDNGNETEWELTEGLYPDYMVKNLEQASEYILIKLLNPVDNDKLVRM